MNCIIIELFVMVPSIGDLVHANQKKYENKNNSNGSHGGSGILICYLQKRCV
ncbi:MAG: hypothetical protein RL747_376 [Bacteroidota bacterium]